MSTDSKDYYRLLDISKDASIEEIKKAFRQLAHRFHPDKNPGDKNAEERFKAICRAYEVLADPQTRLLYDRTGVDDYNKFNRGAYERNPFGRGFNGLPGRGRRCGFKGGCGFRRFYNNGPEKFFRDDITVQDISVTEEDAKNGIEITVRAGNFNSDKKYKIKLPDGIRNGGLIRCIDPENGNDFLIRINYVHQSADN